jgi:hypothetical protein
MSLCNYVQHPISRKGKILPKKHDYVPTGIFSTCLNALTDLDGDMHTGTPCPPSKAPGDIEHHGDTSPGLVKWSLSLFRWTNLER